MHWLIEDRLVGIVQSHRKLRRNQQKRNHVKFAQKEILKNNFIKILCWDTRSCLRKMAEKRFADP